MQKLSRRQVLAGAAAAGIVGWAASCTGRPLPVGQASVVRKPGPAGGVLVSGRFQSTQMHRVVGWSLSAPNVAPAGIIYCLHGYNENHQVAFDQIGLPVVAANLKAPVVVAAVDGGNGYWHPRADGTDAQALLFDEFMPLVETLFKVTKRALLGWSMGGYGALLAAERSPEMFRAVAAASPALWTSASRTAPGAFDDPADYRSHDVFAGVDHLAPLTVRVDCGTSDPFLQADKQFAARLQPQHQGSFGPGGHNAGYWHQIAPGQIATIMAAFQS
jgi:enterochelin esterase-like enzyme